MNDVNEELIDGSRSLSTMPLIFSEPQQSFHGHVSQMMGRLILWHAKFV